MVASSLVVPAHPPSADSRSARRPPSGGSQPKRPSVVKASGQRETFSPSKLHRSLRRSGASEELARDVEHRVAERTADQELTTRQLERLAQGELRRGSRSAAVRYGLRRALMSLGPTGFPFERLVAQLLENQGWRTQLDVLLEGRCVSHEIDVLGERGAERLLVECKYHNAPGHRTDVRVALYVRARALDIAEADGGRSRFMLATNTKFTADAIRYASCTGLELLGWDTPAGAGLIQRFSHGGLLPVTCLRSLSGAQQRALLQQDVVTVADLLARPEQLEQLRHGRRGSRPVLREAEELQQHSPIEV